MLTPGMVIFVCAFWLIGPLVRWATPAAGRMTYLAAYVLYFAIAVLAVAVEYWPRHDPAAEGLRRAYRLLPVDPEMALVRGRGALEHSLRLAAENRRLPLTVPDGPAGVHDLLQSLRTHMPADLYTEADQLRRLANEAAHDPDWHVERSKARIALRAAVRMRRFAIQTGRRSR